MFIYEHFITKFLNFQILQIDFSISTFQKVKFYALVGEFCYFLLWNISVCNLVISTLRFPANNCGKLCSNWICLRNDDEIHNSKILFPWKLRNWMLLKFNNFSTTMANEKNWCVMIVKFNLNWSCKYLPVLFKFISFISIEIQKFLRALILIELSRIETISDYLVC